MMLQSKMILMAAALFAIGCTGASGEAETTGTGEGESIGESEASNDPHDPTYGPSQDMTGIWGSSFETSVFQVCNTGKESCARSAANRGVQGCWLDFSSEASATLDQYLDQAFGNAGRHWLEFRGRETIRHGNYGHLGGYNCQIIVDEITAGETLEVADNPMG